MTLAIGPSLRASLDTGLGEFESADETAMEGVLETADEAATEEATLGCEIKVDICKLTGLELEGVVVPRAVLPGADVDDKGSGADENGPCAAEAGVEVDEAEDLVDGEDEEGEGEEGEGEEGGDRDEEETDIIDVGGTGDEDAGGLVVVAGGAEETGRVTAELKLVEVTSAIGEDAPELDGFGEVDEVAGGFSVTVVFEADDVAGGIEVVDPVALLL